MILTARACERRRLKRFILGEMKLSPSLYARLKFEGSVTVNGAEVRDGNLFLAPGDEVALRLPESPAYTPVPCERKVPVLYEDEHLLIVNKPAPMACQSAPGRGDGLESCIYHYLGRPKDFVWRPVNRLDSGTGGLMVIARTHYQTLAKGQGLGLIRFRLENGRTHQIRAHMAHLGCPLVGDWLYGCEDPRLPGRFALHCFRLRLVHPITGRTLTFAAPPPPEMRPLMTGLRPTRPL